MRPTGRPSPSAAITHRTEHPRAALDGRGARVPHEERREVERVRRVVVQRDLVEVDAAHVEPDHRLTGSGEPACLHLGVIWATDVPRFRMLVRPDGATDPLLV